VTAMRVLVADPVTIFRTGVRNLLRRESDFEVVEASSCEEAELRLEDGCPEIALIDLDLPPKGGVDAVKYLLGGQIQFIFSDTLPAMQHIRAGKLRALCVTGESRYELLPDQVPCQGDARGLVAVNWWGVLYPAGTPKNIVDKLHADTVKVLADPDTKKRFADLGVEAKASTPAEFSAFIKAETEKYAKLIKEANIKVNP